MEKDRVKPYLLRYMDEFIFSELSEQYLEDAGLSDFLLGVPVPLRVADAAKAAGEGLHISAIGSAMARVIGIDPEFRYADAYLRFMGHFLHGKEFQMMMAEADSAIESGDMDGACIWLRAALCSEPDDPLALYGYATSLCSVYSDSTDENTVGMLKAEALDIFETLSMDHPDFLPAWYNLGYMYLNLGLYTKASVAWKRYLELHSDENSHADATEEIRERLAQLETPIAIENACNLVLSGNYTNGIEALSHFSSGKYSKWWPLWYHMGLAHLGLGETDNAEKAFKRVLALNGTQLDTMRELVKIYSHKDRDDLVKKYTDKIELIETRGVQRTERE